MPERTLLLVADHQPFNKSKKGDTDALRELLTEQGVPLLITTQVSPEIDRKGKNPHDILDQFYWEDQLSQWDYPAFAQGLRYTKGTSVIGGTIFPYIMDAFRSFEKGKNRRTPVEHRVSETVFSNKVLYSLTGWELHDQIRVFEKHFGTTPAHLSIEVKRQVGTIVPEAVLKAIEDYARSTYIRMRNGFHPHADNTTSTGIVIYQNDLPLPNNESDTVRAMATYIDQRLQDENSRAEMVVNPHDPATQQLLYEADEFKQELANKGIIFRSVDKKP